jgi:cytochrome c oxidase subunit 4
MSTRRLDIVWLGLMAATALTWTIGRNCGASPLAASAALAIAALKAWAIIEDFMALRGVAFAWRAPVLGWLLAALAAILLPYWLGLR